MTSNTTANPSHARGVANPALTAALAITAIAAATLAGAWFMQLVLGIQPCELCLAQRYAYYLVAPLAALIAIAAARDAPRGALVAGLAVVALVTLGNAGLAAYHSGVEWGFWQGLTACTGPVGNLGSPATCWSVSTPSRWSVRRSSVGVFGRRSPAGRRVDLAAMAAIAAWACAGPRSGGPHGEAARSR